MNTQAQAHTHTHTTKITWISPNTTQGRIGASVHRHNAPMQHTYTHTHIRHRIRETRPGAQRRTIEVRGGNHSRHRARPSALTHTLGKHKRRFRVHRTYAYAHIDRRERRGRRGGGRCGAWLRYAERQRERAAHARCGDSRKVLLDDIAQEVRVLADLDTGRADARPLADHDGGADRVQLIPNAARQGRVQEPLRGRKRHLE